MRGLLPNSGPWATVRVTECWKGPSCQPSSQEEDSNLCRAKLTRKGRVYSIPPRAAEGSGSALWAPTPTGLGTVLFCF